MVGSAVMSRKVKQTVSCETKCSPQDLRTAAVGILNLPPLRDAGPD